MDTKSLVLDARRLWERGRRETRAAHVELYLKRAQRHRVTRAATSESIETGCALRWGSRHVAIVGTSDAELSRAIATPAMADPGTLAVGLDIPSERFDLEPTTGEAEDTMLGDEVEAVELGRTAEVIVGAEGWVAVRTRARSIATLAGGTRLVARRGFDVLSHLPEPVPAPRIPEEAVVLAPSAAAAVVARIAATVHGSSPPLGRGVGPGWILSDEPRDTRGLAGGDFDDAGFPTLSRPLAEDGRIVAGIDGPGCYWRRSFRDPPRALPSNLVVPGNGGSDPRAVTLCRVLPLSRRDWVLELPGRYVRTSPEALLLGCRGFAGGAETTAEGVITPGLIFEI